MTVPRCSLRCVGWLRLTEHRQDLQSRVQHVILTLPIIAASVQSVIKRLRGGSRVGATQLLLEVATTARHVMTFSDY